jgi:preprotein translocase subunit SecA
MKRFASERVAGLMERLGLEDDVAIESNLVSKTIASAQNRVEGFNFDIRKRVVEFDDVINKQRETIYAERDKVLKNEDLTDTVRAFLDEEIDSLVDSHLAGEDPDAWDVEALSQMLIAMGLSGDDVSADTLWDLGSREAVGEHLREVADERLEAREAEVGEEAWGQVERFVLLRTIDSLWVDHLTEIDDMRRGIGLRGYAQQDPLNEFRREAYRMYEELRDLIRHGVASTIFRVTVQRQESPEARLAASLAQGAAALTGSGGNGRPAARPALAGAAAGTSTATATMGPAGTATSSGNGASVTPSMAGGSGVRNIRASLGDEPVASSSTNGSGANGGARPGYTPTGERIGRNDPCWCGSGAKYKKCHGR